MSEYPDYWKEDAAFPRFLTVEEAARLLGVLPEWISLWIGECKLPVAARSEYCGFLLRTVTVETVGHDLASALPPEARFESPVEAPRRTNRTRSKSARAALAATSSRNSPAWFST